MNPAPFGRTGPKKVKVATPAALVRTVSNPSRYRPDGLLVSSAKNSIVKIEFGLLVNVPVTSRPRGREMAEVKTGASWFRLAQGAKSTPNKVLPKIEFAWIALPYPELTKMPSAPLNAMRLAGPAEAPFAMVSERPMRLLLLLVRRTPAPLLGSATNPVRSVPMRQPTTVLLREFRISMPLFRLPLMTMKRLGSVEPTVFA